MVADVHGLFSAAVGEALAARGFEVCAERPDSGPEAVRVAEEEHPDVAVVDAWLPHLEPSAVVRLVQVRAPTCAVVVVAGFYNPAQIQGVLDEGAAAYLPKTVDMDQLVEVIERAHAGERPVAAERVADLQGRLAHREEESRSVWERLMRLSNREIDVLVLLDRGCDNREIAKALGVTEKTVANHMQRMLQKTEAHSRNQLLTMARDHAFIAPSPHRWRRFRGEREAH